MNEVAQLEDRGKLETYVALIKAVEAPTLTTLEADDVMRKASWHLSVGLALLAKFYKGD